MIIHNIETYYYCVLVFLKMQLYTILHHFFIVHLSSIYKVSEWVHNRKFELELAVKIIVTYRWNRKKNNYAYKECATVHKPVMKNCFRQENIFTKVSIICYDWLHNKPKQSPTFFSLLSKLKNHWKRYQILHLWTPKYVNNSVIRTWPRYESWL